YGRNIRVRCSTNITIQKGSEKYWNPKSGRIKHPNDIFGASEINEKLLNYEIEFEKAIQYLEKNQNLTQRFCDKAIKNILNINTNEKTENDVSKSNNVISYFDWYITFYSEKISPNSKKPLT